jgi:hypothetical protein
MRSLLIVGLLVALLIVGILVLQNMGGGENPAGAPDSPRSYTQRAEEAARQVQDKIDSLKQQMHKSD